MKRLGDFDWKEVIVKNLKHSDKLADYVTGLRGVDFVSLKKLVKEEEDFFYRLKDVTTSLVRGNKYMKGIKWTDFALSYYEFVLSFFKQTPPRYFSHLTHFLRHISSALRVLASTLEDERYKKLAYALTRSYKDIKKSIIAYLELLIKFMKEEVKNG